MHCLDKRLLDWVRLVVVLAGLLGGVPVAAGEAPAPLVQRGRLRVQASKLGDHYAYKYELPETVEWVKLDGGQGAGIPLKHRLGVQYHAWENNLDFGFGIRHYGDKWGDAQLRRISDGMLNLLLSAPSRPAVRNSPSWTSPKIMTIASA